MIKNGIALAWIGGNLRPSDGGRTKLRNRTRDLGLFLSNGILSFIEPNT